MTDDWTAEIPGLAAPLGDLDAATRRDFLARARMAQLPAGTALFGPGKPAENMLLLLEGAVRVCITAENGREIVLYRVGPGESCVLSTACLLSQEDYAVDGVADTDIRAVLIPVALFDTLLARSAAFRRFVFSAYARRMTDLFLVIEEVAFRRVDKRLAEKLADLAESAAGGEIRTTHQQIAAELGTAREVVSRQMQEFQRKGWVEGGRGVVRVRDRAALAAFAGTH